MTTIPEIISGHFEGQMNLTNGHRRGEDATLEEILRAARTNITNLNSGLSSSKSVYVNPAGIADTPDGSKEAPFLTIQAALDYAETLGAPSLVWVDILSIVIAPGLYEERPVYHGQWGIVLHAEVVSTIPTVEIRGSGGPTLTITNATPASLVTYNASGDYADLVWQGNDGCKAFYADGIYFSNWSSKTAIQLLGVVETTTTEFGDYQVGFFRCSTSTAATYGLYSRNCKGITFQNPTNPWDIGIFNASYVQARGCLIETLELEYDGSSIYGRPADGAPTEGTVNFYDGYIEDIICSEDQVAVFHGVSVNESVVINDSANVKFIDCTIDDAGSETYPIDINDTATVTFDSGRVISDTHIEGGATVVFRDFHFAGDLNVTVGAGTVTCHRPHIEGDVTLDNGAGAVVFNGGEYMGALTDVGGRLTFNLGTIGT
jgi:hypothetical protein